MSSSNRCSSLNGTNSPFLLRRIPIHQHAWHFHRAIPSFTRVHHHDSRLNVTCTWIRIKNFSLEKRGEINSFNTPNRCTIRIRKRFERRGSIVFHKGSKFLYHWPTRDILSLIPIHQLNYPIALSLSLARYTKINTWCMHTFSRAIPNPSPTSSLGKIHARQIAHVSSYPLPPNAIDSHTPRSGHTSDSLQSRDSLRKKRGTLRFNLHFPIYESKYRSNPNIFLVDPLKFIREEVWRLSFQFKTPLPRAIIETAL